MKLKNIELKENEILLVGYFDNQGNEYIEKGRCQRLSGWAFKNLKESNPNLEVVKSEYGYATKYINEINKTKKED